MRHAIAASATVLLLCPVAAAAQEQVLVSVEAQTDHRRRGISWSEGRAAAELLVDAPVGAGFRLVGGAVTLRNGDRHGGAAAAVDAGLRYERDVGLWRLGGGITGHVFPGGSRGYVELGGSAGLLIGPAQLDVFGEYAPDQRAIGGDNLYLGTRLRGAIPGTPVSLVAAAGRSSGRADNPVRAARLRPDNRYHDWRLGASYVIGPATLGVDYVGTDVDRMGLASRFADRAHARDTVVARVGFAF